MSRRHVIEGAERPPMAVEVVGNASDETGRVVYSYLCWVVQKVMDLKVVSEGTTFNADECREIKKRLLAGPLDCFFTDGDECKFMYMDEFLSVFHFQRPIPENLPQYRYR